MEIFRLLLFRKKEDKFMLDGLALKNAAVVVLITEWQGE